MLPGMKKVILLFSVMLVAQLVTGAEKPAHLFILSGQSNMGGLKPENDFMPEARRLFPEAEVAYIKVARGGQPIRLWVNEWNAIAEKYGLDKRIGPKNGGEGSGTVYYAPILSQFAALLEKHPNPASVTFCWMQGERDAKEKLDAAYADAFNQLIGNLRRDLKQPNMYFVIGRLSDFGKPDQQNWQHVREIQVALADADARGAWVDCDDLNDKEKNGQKRNDLHYTREGYQTMGYRMARQAKRMIEGKKPAADGRPKGLEGK